MYSVAADVFTFMQQENIGAASRRVASGEFTFPLAVTTALSALLWVIRRRRA